MRVADVTMGCRVILLGLVLVAAFGAVDAQASSLILGILFTPATARLARAALLSELESDYYLAAVSVGAPTWRIVLRELLPNTMPVLLARASIVAAERDLRRGQPELRRPRRPAAGGVVGDAAPDGLHQPLPLVLVSDLPRPRDRDRRARAEHARRQPPAGTRPGAPVMRRDRTTQPVLDVRGLCGRVPARPERRSRRSAASPSRSRRGSGSGSSASRASGKSLTALALMRLLPPPGRIAGGEVLLGGTRPDARCREREMAAVRGARIAMVYQDPMSSLNPVQHDRTPDRRGDPRARGRVEDAAPRQRAIELLGDVGLAAPAAALRQLPARVLGRDAAARDDRDGDLREPRRPDRRRADDRARRDDAGADHRPARPPRRRARAWR